jgi:hypothetical protein
MGYAISRASEVVGLDLISDAIPMEPASLAFDSPFRLHVEIEEYRGT